jgi:peptide/nickel transport system substrate-binding protein
MARLIAGWRAWALALASLALMSIPALAASAQTVLRSRLNADILSTDPGTKRDENTDAVLLHMVEGLVAFKEDTSVGPLLAKSVNVSPDGKTYTFQLRGGVKFHNGAPLTSAEVVWSFNRYLNPATHWRCLPELDGHGKAKIVGVKALGPSTVAVTLDAPFAMFLKTLARPDCGETGILHPASLAADGSWKSPVGTGPFRFSSWKSGEYIELERNADYAALPGPRDGNTGGKRGLVDKVRFVVIPESSAARAALISGAIDILDGVNPNELPGLKSAKGIKIDLHPTMDVYALIFQTADPVLKDVRLRKALALSIDTVALAKAVTEGTARPNSSITPSSSTVFYDAAQARHLAPNPATARKLAAASGYRGQPITLTTNKRYPQMFDAAVLVQGMAQQAGINMKIEVLDWAAELDRYGKGAYQVMTFAYSGRLDPALSYDAVIGEKAKEPRKVWDNPSAAALLKTAMDTDDVASRRQAFDQLNALMQDQTPLLVLYNPAHVAAVRANVDGFKGWSAVQQRLWGVSVR